MSGAPEKTNFLKYNFERVKESGKLVGAKCLTCNKKIKSTYVNRLRDHFNSCLIPFDAVSLHSSDDEDAQPINSDSIVKETPTSHSSNQHEYQSTPRCPPKKKANRVEPRGAITQFYGSCSENQSKGIKTQILRFVLGSAISLDSVEHKSFKKLLGMLCPAFLKYQYSADEFLSDILPNLYDEIIVANKSMMGNILVLSRCFWMNRSLYWF